MQAIQAVKESCVYHLCAVLAGWFGAQWRRSAIVSWLTGQKSGRQWSEGSIFYRLFLLLHRGLSRLFELLRLDRLLTDSLFRITALWAGLAIVLAPLLPTMAVLLLVLASYGSLLLNFGCDPARRLVYFPMNKFVYLYAFVYAFATLASVNRSGSLYVGLLSVCFFLFFIVVTNAVTRWSQVKLLLNFAVAAGVLVSLYGIYQFLNPARYANTWVDFNVFEAVSFRVYSTLGNPNVLGEYFLLIVPMAGALLLTARSWRSRLIYLGCAGVMMLCLLLTYSRGCYLGILFAGAMFLVMLDRRFILLGVVGLLLSPMLLPESILERFTSIGNMADTSTSYRVYIWMGTLAMLKDYWFSGVGPGEAAFNMAYPAYAYHEVSAPHAHNLFLQILSDAGVPGLLVFGLLLISFYRTMFTSLRVTRSREKQIFLMAGSAAVTGFLVQSMTDYTFYNYRVMLLFWATLAISVLFARLSPEKEGAL